MTTVLYGTPAPIDHDDHAAFTAKVKTMLADKQSKSKSALHKGVPLVHYAVRTRNVAALNLLAKAGLNLNKPFKEEVWNAENPNHVSTTPLDEALRTDDPAMVKALFQAGLDPKILAVDVDRDKHPYRTILRAGYEPAPCMIDALLDADPSGQARTFLSRALILAMVDCQTPFFTLIRHLFERMPKEGEFAGMFALTVHQALYKVASDMGTNHHPWVHAMIPLLLDVGGDAVLMDGLPGEQGFVLSMIVNGMRPSAKREYLVQRLLNHVKKPDIHAETNLGNVFNHYGTAEDSPFVLAMRNNDKVMVDAFIAAGALEGTGLTRARARFEQCNGDWPQEDRERVHEWLVPLETAALKATLAQEEGQAFDNQQAARSRARL